MGRLTSDILLSVTLDAICSRNRYTKDPEPVIEELRTQAGERIDILTESVGTWVGFFESVHTMTLCAALRHLPGVEPWIEGGNRSTRTTGPRHPIRARRRILARETQRPEAGQPNAGFWDPLISMLRPRHRLAPERNHQMALVSCRECGSQISDSAATCPSCGVAAPAGVGTLTFTRPSLGNGAVGLEVHVDGKPYGRLRAMGKLSVSVPPGDHHIELVTSQGKSGVGTVTSTSADTPVVVKLSIMGSPKIS